MTLQAFPEPSPDQQDHRTDGGEIPEAVIDAVDLGLEVAGATGELGSCFPAMPDCSVIDCSVVDCAPGCV